ncbi:MAG: gluconate kinase [Cyclobacteriaceae bacterium]|nr:MAG: gluconate kinase [Cyclobacteriaceae bacterium]
MALNSFVIAIDIGTTSTKALAVTATGKVLAQHQVFYSTAYSRPGYAEQNANEILAAVISALNTIETQLDLSKAVALTFSSAMHSVVAVNEKCEALTPLMIWADTRSSAQAKKLRHSELGIELHRRSGTPIHPMSPLCKLMWLQINEPEMHSRAYKFISIKEFVWYHLTGEFSIDYSIASATGLFDIHDQVWNKSALQLAGITAQQLSDPVSVTHQSKLKAGKDLSRYQQIPLIIGASDGCLAQLGSDAMQPGVLTVTLGTSGAVRRSATRTLADPHSRLFNYILTDYETVAGGATNNGTAVMDWFIKEFSNAEKLPAMVARVCKEIPAGSDGLLALPFLQGERAPIYNPEARGVFFNISMQHTQQHFGRALLEAICYELKWITESVEAVCGSSDKVVVSGGITHFPEWVQMLADVFNREVIVSSDHDASAMGAARLAFQKLQLPFAFTTEVQTTFTPNSNNAQVYAAGYTHFRALYQALEKLF